MATLTRINGWETGSVTEYGGGAAGGPAVSTTYAHSGLRSLRVYRATPSACHVYYTQAGTVTHKIGRVYVRFTAWPSADINLIWSTITGAGSVPGIKLDIATHRLVAIFNATEGNAAAVDLSLDTWYRIEYHFDISTTTYKIDFQVAEEDGTATAATQSTSAEAASAYFVEHHLGAYGTDTYDLYYDDWLQSDTPADYPLGAGIITALYPNAAGVSNPGTYIQDHTSTIISDVSNPAYVELGEVPAFGGWMYIKQIAVDATLYAEVGFEDLTSTVIWGVSAHISYAASAATPANAGSTLIRDYNGQETTIYSGDMSETARGIAGAMVTPPTGGWTQTHVNALRGRVGYATNVDTIPYWHGLCLQVAGPLPAGTPVIKVINE